MPFHARKNTQGFPAKPTGVLMSEFRPGALPPGFSRLADQIMRTAPGYLPMLRALETGALALVILRRESPASTLRDFAARRQPALALIKDDDAQPTGPAGWRCAARLRRCADCAVIGGSAREVSRYSAALSATGGARLVLVNTDPPHEAAWSAWFARFCPVIGAEAPPAAAEDQR